MESEKSIDCGNLEYFKCYDTNFCFCFRVPVDWNINGIFYTV